MTLIGAGPRPAPHEVPVPLETYEAALDWLFSATDYEKMQRVRYNADTFSLDRMWRLLGLVGSPERRLRSVHVAGTKGKGSTAAMVHAMALGCGLKAGLYTSPHLVDIRERIQVGRETIAPEDLRGLIAAARPHVERLRAAGDPPTFFEIFTALALRHFAEVGTDLVVAEVGLGGRLDATNVLAPDASVITAVSLDHVYQLGGTLGSIAAEKAGIIKPGVPTVSQPQAAEALAVIERRCGEAGAPLVLVGRDVTFAWRPAEEGRERGIAMEVRTARCTYGGLFVPLMGGHQAENAAAAIAAAELVGPMAARPLGPDVVRAALRQVHWPGHMEFHAGRPDLLLDGAHNRASVERLLEAVAAHFPGRRAQVLFASAADKDIEGMLQVLAGSPTAAGVVFTRTANPRAADPSELRATFERFGGRAAEAAAEVPAALERAKARAGPDGMVLVCGSLYLVGEVKGGWLRRPSRLARAHKGLDSEGSDPLPQI